MPGITGDYVFKEVNGALEYVGDFDGLYKNIDNPWNQKGSSYFIKERLDLVNLLRKYPVNSIVDIGCGVGFGTFLIQQCVCHNITGIDISPVAIEKAKNYFPGIDFHAGDIRYGINGNYDMAVMEGVLWYVLDDLESLIKNINSSVNKYFVINQAFITEQKYAKKEMDGFSGLVKWVSGLKEFELLEAHYYKGKNERHNTGTVVLGKRTV